MVTLRRLNRTTPKSFRSQLLCPQLAIQGGVMVTLRRLNRNTPCKYIRVSDPSSFAPNPPPREVSWLRSVA